MASVSSCEYKVCRSIGRESHFRFSLWLCLPRSSSDLHLTASPPATPTGRTPPPISAGLSRPPRSGPLCTSGFDGGPPAPRALPCTGRERPGAWLTLCLAEPEPRSAGAHCREGKPPRTIPQGRFLFGFLVCGTRLKIVIRSSRGVPTGGAPSNSFRQSVLGGPGLPARF